MMSFSCMKAFYEYTPYLYSRKNILWNQTFRLITHKKVSKPAKEFHKEIPKIRSNSLSFHVETGPFCLCIQKSSFSPCAIFL